MSSDMRSANFKVPGSKAVRIDLFWHKNYAIDTSTKAIAKARDTLAGHGLKLDLNPRDGGRAESRVIDSRVDPHDQLIHPRHYQALKDAVEAADAARNRVAVVFCEFKAPDRGLTVSAGQPGEDGEMAQCWVNPLCLVGALLASDELTMLHEVGHAAGLDDYYAEAAGHTNFMNNRSEKREAMYRFQLEKMAMSYYVV